MFVLALLPMVVWLFLGSSYLALHEMQASSARGELLTADFSVIDPHRMMRTYGPAEGYTKLLVHA